MTRSRISRAAPLAMLLAASVALPAPPVNAQQATSTVSDAPARILTLAAALAAARSVSPDLVAAREALAAAA